jgi:hypothetical protein
MSERMQTHTFSYRHDGKLWALDIRASSPEDARARIGKLTYATYDGVVVARLPVALSPIGVAAVWVRNTLLRPLKR